MTNEEAIKTIREFIARFMTGGKSARSLSQALDALEEASREIERLKTHICSLRCESKTEDHEKGCPLYTGTYA